MSSKKKTFSVKMVLCGDIGVGKTCLFTRITDLEYNPNPITTSNDYHKKTYEKGDKIINCEIWDTAGQEKYYSLNRIFFKDAKIAIIVYDITRRETYEKLKDFWINEIKSHSTNLSIIGIAANKCDLYDSEQVNEQEARDYAKSVGAFYKLCSALNNEGINELVDDLINHFLSTLDNQSNNQDNPNDNSDFKLDKKKQEKKKKCC